MGEDDRVVVDVDDAGGRVEALGYLVDIFGGRQARADVNELPDAGLFDQVPDHPAEDRALGPDAELDGGQRRDDLITERPVGGEIVFAAEKVVIYAGDMRPRRIEIGENGLMITHGPIL